MFELRPFQKSALSALEALGHVICVSHTGSGKSLIYERAAAFPRRRTLLITPLVALAHQQAARLRAAGIETRLGTGGARETPTSRTAAWIISPEMLLHPFHRSTLRNWRPDFLVVDECHCLWEWGDQFRPAFNKIPDLLRTYSIPRSLWLTATLPAAARESLILRLPQPIRQIGQFELPPSLSISVRKVPWSNRCEALLKWIDAQTGDGIVFTLTREGTERIARWLRATGMKVAAYHAGMGSEERRAIEGALARRELRAVIATSAFGMGMDYPHLGWVALWQIPYSILTLAQAIGRVGRTGKKGNALVLWDYDDFRTLDWTVNSSPRRSEDLRQMLKFVESPGCPRSAISQYFGSTGIPIEQTLPPPSI